MRINEKFTTRSGIAVMLLLLLPFALLCFFIYPSADDFLTAAWMRDKGFADYMQFMFSSWTGRYTSVFLDVFNPLLYHSQWIYRMMPLLIMVCLFFSIYLFLKNFCRGHFLNREIFAGSAIIFTLYMNLLPGISESLYWFTGAKTYLFSVILILLMGSAFWKFTYPGFRRLFRILLLGIAAVLAFLISGVNETAMLLIFELMFIYFLWNVYKLKKFDLASFLVVVIIIACGIFQWANPGNHQRMEQFSERGLIGVSIWGAAQSLVKLAGIFLQNPPFLLMSVLFLPYAMREVSGDNPLRQFAQRHPVLSVIFSALIVYSLYLPSWLATGMDAPLRIHSLVAIVFIFLWTFNLFILMQYLRAKGTNVIVIPGWVKILIMALAFVFTVTDFHKEPGGSYHYRGNIAGAWADLFFRAVPYQKQMQEREQLIQNAQANKQTKVVIPKLKNVPETIHFIDITDDPGNWMNKGMSAYYNLDTIAVK